MTAIKRPSQLSRFAPNILQARSRIAIICRHCSQICSLVDSIRDTLASNADDQFQVEIFTMRPLLSVDKSAMIVLEELNKHDSRCVLYTFQSIGPKWLIVIDDIVFHGIASN